MFCQHGSTASITLDHCSRETCREYFNLKYVHLFKLFHATTLKYFPLFIHLHIHHRTRLKIIFEWWPVMLTGQTNFSPVVSRF